MTDSVVQPADTDTVWVAPHSGYFNADPSLGHKMDLGSARRGDTFYLRNGYKHREGAPAVERFDGGEEWWE